MTCNAGTCDYTNSFSRTPTLKIHKKARLTIVCNYSTLCDGKCEKCQHLNRIQIVSATELSLKSTTQTPSPTQTQSAGNQGSSAKAQPAHDDHDDENTIKTSLIFKNTPKKGSQDPKKNPQPKRADLTANHTQMESTHHSLWKKPRRKYINDIPTIQYATWAKLYRYAYETGACRKWR